MMRSIFLFLFLYLFSSAVFAISFSPVEIPGANSSALIPAQTDQSAIYAKTNIGIFQSIDAGENWTKFADFSNPMSIRHLAFVNNQLIITTNTVAYKRMPDGSWDIIYELPSGSSDKLSYTLINPDQSEQLFQIGSLDSRISVTGGASWESFLSYYTFRAMVLSEDWRKIYIVASLDGFPNYEATMHIYDMQTQSWTTIEVPNNCSYHGLQTTPFFPDRIYLLSSGFCDAQLVYSDNDGSEWDSILFPSYLGYLEYTYLADLEISDQNPDFFVISLFTTLEIDPVPAPDNYISYDGGENWVKQLNSGFFDSSLIGGNLLVNGYPPQQLLTARNFLGASLSVPVLDIKGLILMIGLTIIILMGHLNKKKARLNDFKHSI